MVATCRPGGGRPGHQETHLRLITEGNIQCVGVEIRHRRGIPVDALLLSVHHLDLATHRRLLRISFKLRPRGFAKALWVLFVLIVRIRRVGVSHRVWAGRCMIARVQAQAAEDAAMRRYIQDAVKDSPSSGAPPSAERPSGMLDVRRRLAATVAPLGWPSRWLSRSSLLRSESRAHGLRRTGARAQRWRVGTSRNETRAPRVAGSVVALVSVALIIVGDVAGQHSGLAIVALVALIGLSASMTRYALGRDRRSVKEARAPGVTCGSCSLWSADRQPEVRWRQRRERLTSSMRRDDEASNRSSSDPATICSNLRSGRSRVAQT